MAGLTGKTLGKYKLTERLGHGGMADVYKAHHTKLDRDVTIKVLHSHLIEGQDFLERFEREAKAVAALRHPHIVGIHDFDVEGELYYMVMEYIDGGNLGEKLEALAQASAYLPIQQVASILRQVGEALDEAHQQGIIHRDIKPSNILLDSQGDAYLTDFGIARMLSGTQFTATGALIGTPTYMSPEQGQGLELDPTSDIYSLGIVLFEMLTGKTPFASDTPLAVIHKHIHAPLPLASELRPGMPASVEKVLFTALAKERQERFTTAQAFTLAFEKALTPEAVSALESPNLPEGREFAALPTMRIEEDSPAPKRSELPTEAMSAQTLAEVGELAGAEPPPEPAPEPETIASPRAQPPRGTGSTQPVRPDPEPRPATSWPARLKAWPVILVLIVVLVAIALLFAFGNKSEPEVCSNVEACMALFEQRMGAGDMDGAIVALERAIDTVPEDEHQAFAWLWCNRGGLLDEVGRHDEADASRETCAAWEQAASSSPFENNACRTLEECITKFGELHEAGDLEGSLGAIDEALDKVPDDAHPDFAWLWCDRGGLLDEVGRHDEADASRETCMVWERGE